MGGIFLSVSVDVAADMTPLRPEEEKNWLNHLIPLPKEITIPGCCRISPAEVGLKIEPEAGDIEKQALQELHVLFQSKTSRMPTGTAFEICIGVIDANGMVAGMAVTNGNRLQGLPNCDQAYIIQSAGANRLIVAGRHAQGVYFGVQTLRQLLEAKLTREQAVIPMASVTDWPDMDERGLWCGTLALPSLKLNLMTIVSAPKGKIQRDQPIRVNFTPTFEYARLHALKTRVQTAHLNYWANYGLYEAYPELAGKGDKAVPGVPTNKARELRVPCASNPLMKKVIAEWLTDLAAQGVRDICVWLDEHQAQCQCEACLKVGQFRAETTAAQEAWRDVRKQYPDLQLRVFCCTAGASSNDTYAILMALEPGVKVERCYGSYYEAFNACAAQGRWVGVFSGSGFYLSSSYVRYYGAYFRDFFRDYHRRQWQGGVIINDGNEGLREIFGYSLAALAEWSWNVNGRTPGELALAWATRQGYAYPEKVAAWLKLMDPLETQLVRAALSPGSGRWQEAVARLRAKQAPDNRGGMFAELSGTNGVEAKLAVCREALAIADALDAPEFGLETRYVTALLRALRALHALAIQAAQPETTAGQQDLQAKLDEVSREITALIQFMDQLLDLLTSCSKTAIEKQKRIHGDPWRQQLAAITAAVGSVSAGPTKPNAMK